MTAAGRIIECLGVCVIIGIQLLSAGHAARAADNQPNVLFIAIDDLRTELGCYDLPYVDSPHLDRLASQGVLFTNHFVQVPTCGASRYALLTGRSPHRSQALGNAAMYSGKTRLKAKQLEGAQTFPELFRRSGYRTVCIGKISHTPDGKVYAYDGRGDGSAEMPNAWDSLVTPYGSWKRGWGTFFAYAGGRHREDGQGHIDLMEFVAERDEDLPDGLMAQRSIQVLRELKNDGKPFFMGLGFFKPHLPFVATKGDWEAVRDRDVPAPSAPEKVSSSYWHRSGEFYKYRAEFPKTRPLAAKDAITCRKAYLACVRYVDRQVGKVLAALDELQLRESTIVVVWGDHGWHLGDSAIWGKHSPFDRALKSTLIIRAPGVSKAGHQCNALVESLDLYPTLIDLCAPQFQRTAAPLDGHSLRPLLEGRPVSLRSAAISYWRDAVSVRTPTHRLITSTKEDSLDKAELYSVETSPDPAKNILENEREQAAKLLQLVPRPIRR